MSAATNSPPAKGEYPEGGRGFLPTLRFPEFRDAGEWEKRKAGSLFAHRTTKGGQGLPIYSVTMNDGMVRRDSLDRKVDDIEDAAGNKKVCRNDIAYNMMRMWQGAIGVAPEDCLVSPAYVVLAPKKDAVPHFFQYLFKLPAMLQLLTSHSRGLTKDRLRLYFDDFAKMEFRCPKVKEQQRIADFLAAIDEHIATETEQLDILKTHKKGLMQQLFPREGETQPRLRFPEFRDAGEWSERKAGSFFAHRTTKGEQDLPIYSVTMNDGMVRRDSLDRKVDDIEDAAGNKKVCRNDIAYNMMRMWQGAMGVAPEDCLVSPAYVVLAPKKDAVPHFFQYLFKLPAMLQLLTSHSRGLTKDRLRLYFDDFAKMEFRCPAVREQQRIADFLASIDARIATQTERLDTLKTHKKALMQQLFPVQEAVAA